MIIEDKFRIERSLEEVWGFFTDIPRVGQCVPGAEGVSQVSENGYAGSLSVRVGPVAANFQGEANVIETIPPARLVAEINGKDRRTSSFIKGTFTANLEQVEPTATEVTYRVDVAIRGRLGQFGSTVIQATAKEMTLAFVDCVQQQLAAGSEGEAGSNTATSPASSRQGSLLAVILRTIRRLLGDVWRRLWPQTS
jgi:carbon monoxide dehydrogenase subunit G